MFELFNFNPLQPAPPGSITQILGGTESPQGEKGIPEKFQPLSGKTHAFPQSSTFWTLQWAGRDPLLYLLASGGQRSRPTPCCIKPC